MTRRGRPALLVAHRGDSARFPENTAAAFDAAVAAGVDGIELDLQVCADDVVVCHDPTLARFGGSRRALAQRSRSELAGCDVGSWFAARFRAERLLTLDGLLARYAPHVELLLELKPARRGPRRALLVERTLAAITRHRARARVRLLCFDRGLLASIADHRPRLRLVLNRTRPPRDVAALFREAPYLAALDCDHRHWRPAAVAACHAAGRETFTWSCNDAASVDRVVGFGMDGVLTDRPGWLARRWDRAGTAG